MSNILAHINTIKLSPDFVILIYKVVADIVQFDLELNIIVKRSVLIIVYFAIVTYLFFFHNQFFIGAFLIIK